MLQELLKNTGLLIILIGVVILGIVVFSEVQTNSYLIISLGLIVGGFMTHIVINRNIN